ncbi:MAG: MATE family efflux transporter [Acholeplasmatales bacterium]|nr:MATE family efflux transporter [Acholeplasmatales bacterium]
MKRNVNMTEGNLFKNIIVFSLPIILSGVLQLLYNACDLIVCRMFGPEHSTAAISSTNSLINLIVNLFLGLSVGANVLMSRCVGMKDKEKGQRVVYTSMIFSLVFGFIVGIFGFFTAGYFLKLMGTTEDVISMSTSYLRIYMLGLPFSMIYNYGAALFRATGDTRRPFIFLALSGIINILLNLLFVISFKMGVPGVAWSTIISQGVSALLIVLALLNSKGFFEFKFKNIRFYKKEAIDIVRIGLPAGLQGAIFSFSNVLIQSSINSLGTDVVDGSGASSSLEGFIYTAMNSVAQACVSFVAANYGARKRENIKKSIYYSLLLVLIMNFIVGGIILLLKNQLLGLYVRTDAAIEAGSKRLIIIAVTYFLCGFMDTMAFALRGIGYSFVPMIVSLIGSCVLRIIWIYTFFRIDALHNIEGLVYSYPISWIITTAVHTIMFIVLFRRIKFDEMELK